MKTRVQRTIGGSGVGYSGSYEIQKAAELFDCIKDIVDEDKKKGQFYLTGSQSIMLMKNVSDSLAGRAGVIRMLGLLIRC